MNLVKIFSSLIVSHVPFDTLEVVSHRSFVPLSLVALFHCFDIQMESFSKIITAIIWKLIEIAM